MASYIRRYTQAGVWVERYQEKLQALNEEYEAEKRAQDEPLEQRLRELEKEIETLRQAREVKSQELDRKYKSKIDELTWFLSPPPVCLRPNSMTLG